MNLTSERRNTEEWEQSRRRCCRCQKSDEMIPILNSNRMSPAFLLHHHPQLDGEVAAVSFSVSHSWCGPRVLLSVSSSLPVSHHIYNARWQERKCFPALGGSLLSQTSSKSQHAMALFTKRNACVWPCVRAHTHTIMGALTASPITLASWFVY